MRSYGPFFRDKCQQSGINMASNINDAVVGAHSVAQTGVIETIGEAAQGGVVARQLRAA